MQGNCVGSLGVRFTLVALPIHRFAFPTQGVGAAPPRVDASNEEP